MIAVVPSFLSDIWFEVTRIHTDEMDRRRCCLRSA